MSTMRGRAGDWWASRLLPIYAREARGVRPVTLSRVVTDRSDLVAFGASESGTMELEVSTSDLEHFVPGSYFNVTIAPAAKVQA